MKFGRGLATLGFLLYLAVILGVVVFVAQSLTLIDRIVHGTLYSYGLQFSLDWGKPYWTILHNVQISLGLLAMFALVSTVLMWRKYVYKSQPVKPVTSESARATTVAPSTPETPSPLVPSVSGSIKCPHCGKSFTQPLRMLDFQGDRPRIVSLCPFCNEVIPPVFRQGERNQDKKVVPLKGKKNNHKLESTVPSSS